MTEKLEYLTLRGGNIPSRSRNKYIQLYPEITDGNLKGALWTFKQQLV